MSCTTLQKGSDWVDYQINLRTSIGHILALGFSGIISCARPTVWNLCVRHSCWTTTEWSFCSFSSNFRHMRPKRRKRFWETVNSGLVVGVSRWPFCFHWNGEKLITTRAAISYYNCRLLLNCPPQIWVEVSIFWCTPALPPSEHCYQISVGKTFYLANVSITEFQRSQNLSINCILIEAAMRIRTYQQDLSYTLDWIHEARVRDALRSLLTVH